MLWATKTIGKRWAQGWHSGIVSSQNWYSKSLVKHIQKISATWMYLHLPSRLSHLPCMFNEGPNQKKKNNSEHLPKEVSLSSGFSFSMVWILCTSRRGRAALFVQAWRCFSEAQSFPPGRCFPVKGGCFCYLNKLELWCWAFVDHDFSHSSVGEITRNDNWWDEHATGLWEVRICELPQDATAGSYFLGSLMSLAMWSRRGEHPNEPRQWHRPWPWWPWDIRSNMRHSLAKAFQSVSNKISRSCGPATWFSIVPPFAQCQLSTVQNSTNTNPICGCYCLNLMFLDVIL